MNSAAAAIAPAAFGSQADFAAAQGWAKSYVSKLKQEGRLVFNAAGLVDFAASLARIKATSGAVERAAPVVQGVAYATAKDEQAFYDKEQARLDYEERIGKLLPAVKVRESVRAAGTLLRVTVEDLATRLPAQLVACGNDERRIHACLVYEFEALLRSFSSDMSTAAHSAAQGENS